MRKKTPTIQTILVFLTCLVFSSPLLAEDNANWDNVNPNYKEPCHDSVNWDNLNLNYKPPKIGEPHGDFVSRPETPKDGLQDPRFFEQQLPNGIIGHDEAIGEMYGVHGPVISCGRIKKEKVFIILDASGVMVGWVSKTKINDQPDLIRNFLDVAEGRSRRYFSGPGNIFADGFESGDTSAWSDTVSQSDNRNFNFRPQSSSIVKLGSSEDDRQKVADELSNQLRDKRNKFSDDRCFGLLIEYTHIIYIIETPHGRVVLKKKKKVEEPPTVPNDPFYYKKAKKKKKLLGILGSSKTAKITIGSNLRMGKGTGLGAKATGVERTKAGADIKDQWGLRKVGYLPMTDPNSAWHISDGKEKNVVVAVIDSGLYMDHPDGPTYVWGNAKEVAGNGVDDDGNGYVDDVQGWNFYDNNEDLTDLKGHGTFVSGIIAAKRDNGIGIAGINPGAIIMPLKVTDKDGNTNSIQIFRAIRYAVDHGAKLLNISLGGRGITKLEQLALNYAHYKGALAFIASGNFGDHLSDFGPANSRRSLAIGAQDFDGTTSTISSWGPNNGLIAPGEEIYSLHSQDAPWMGGSADRERMYYHQSGTSFSTPLVVGTASLMLAKNPDLTHVQIEDILMSTADNMDEVDWGHRAGAGVLNATAALKASPDQMVNIKIVGIKINRDEKEKLKSADVFATIRGPVQSFTIEVGKGKRAKKFKHVSGPYTQQADHSWVARISKDQLRGSRDWVLRIQVTDQQGDVKIAESLFHTRK